MVESEKDLIITDSKKRLRETSLGVGCKMGRKGGSRGRERKSAREKGGVDDRNVGGQGVKNSTFTMVLRARVPCGCLEGENV